MVLPNDPSPDFSHPVKATAMLPGAIVKTKEVMVPCFLKVSVQVDDEMEAEMRALAAVRSLPDFESAGVVVQISSVIAPLVS